MQQWLHLRHCYGEIAFGPGKAALLAEINALGSIAAAGRALGMSDKCVWGLVEEMNALFDPPLVESSRGGACMGGARLTEAGQSVLAEYRALIRLIETQGAPQLAALKASPSRLGS